MAARPGGDPVRGVAAGMGCGPADMPAPLVTPGGDGTIRKECVLLPPPLAGCERVDSRGQAMDAAGGKTVR